jgi:hypothetical protein
MEMVGGAINYVQYLIDHLEEGQRLQHVAFPPLVFILQEDLIHLFVAT